MENKQIELTDEELLFIESLESKLNVTEYKTLRNIVERFVNSTKDREWEIRRKEEQLANVRISRDENYELYCKEKEKKEKIEANYNDVCYRYAKLEVELDLAKAKIEILEGEKNDER